MGGQTAALSASSITASPLPVEVLEGGLAADAHCGDLALLHLRLAADAYDVAVADGGDMLLPWQVRAKSARHAAGTPI